MSEQSNRRRRIAVAREVLLVEVERRCRATGCGVRLRLGLTKEEARSYTGFSCERCEAWNTDALGERDIPDWWEELKITSLEGVRALKPSELEDEPGEVVRRLSDAWRAERLETREGGDAEEGEAGGRRGSFAGEDSF